MRSSTYPSPPCSWVRIMWLAFANEMWIEVACVTCRLRYWRTSVQTQSLSTVTLGASFSRWHNYKMEEDHWVASVSWEINFYCVMSLIYCNWSAPVNSSNYYRQAFYDPAFSFSPNTMSHIERWRSEIPELNLLQNNKLFWISCIIF